MKITESHVSHVTYLKNGHTSENNPIMKCQLFDLVKIAAGKNNHVYGM